MRKKRASLDQIVADGVVRQLGVGPHLHLLKDTCAVRADGVAAENQFIRNLFHGLAGSDKPQDLKLPI